MTKIKSFHDLDVWKIAHEAVLDIYKAVEDFPRKEEYRLVSQLVKAAVSIPTNIAEGMGRFSRKEFLQFLIIARGSIEECKYLLLLSKDLNYIDENNYEKLINKYDVLGMKNNALINSIKKKLN